MSKWFLLPGMGASAKMYDALSQRLSFDVSFIDWPKYKGENSYTEVALRVIDENGIKDGDVVGGSSFGGIVSLEMAKLIKPSAVILIGSAINAGEISAVIYMLAPLARITPIELIQSLSGKQRDFVSQMFADADAEFIRKMCVLLGSWDGYIGPLDRVFRLHGEKDHIIPCPKSGCEVVKDAGHMLAITHPDATAEFLERVRGEIYQQCDRQRKSLIDDDIS